MLMRAAVAAVLIVSCGLFVSGAAAPENAAPRQRLGALPLSLGTWLGVEAPPLADDVVSQLGVDDHVNRYYTSAGAAPISVYVGYYASQRQGDAIHSPENCLPGAGWQMVSGTRSVVPLQSGQAVNKVIIQKGLEKRAVLYWYQGRGRIVANEFANKGYLMLDAARLRRTDGGLVRLIAPMAGSDAAALASLTAFSATLVPHLWSHLP